MTDEDSKTPTATTTTAAVAATPLAIAATAASPVPPAAAPPQATTRGKNSASGAASQNMAAPRKMENVSGREYKYFTEISQMMFVFGEVQDPAPETVNLVEDIVRSQIIELVSACVWTSASPLTGRRADITSSTPRL